ncbi:MAG TPA: nucleoside triphosphate pyrophosphatase [Nitrospiria bacterium]|nr:nucleoside triphosphate pyrophosphatase [Nitrospiria bacterium]
MRLILASSSPRRKEILALLGLPFEVVSPGLTEVFQPGRTPSDEAVYWALEKARAVHRQATDAIVIGSDTVIDLDGKTIGKPSDQNDAVRILSLLAGRTHAVVTAVAVVFPDRNERVAVETTMVRMRPASKEVLVRYAATGEPSDKAGAYSLQGEGRKRIASIKGDYLAAVGLPLRALAGILSEEGIPPAADVERIYRARTVMNWKRYEA